MKDINVILARYLHPTLVYRAVQFGQDPDPDPDLRVKKRFKNPPSLKLIPDLIFGVIVLKLSVKVPQTILFNISNVFVYTTSGSKVLTQAKLGPSRSGQIFNIAPYGNKFICF